MLHAELSRTDQIVRRLTGSWRASPPVTVVNGTADLPVPAPEDVRGMWFRGGAWIVANTQPLSNVAGTMAHEVIGHGAMRDTLGKHWRGFMHNIQSGLRGGDYRLHHLREHVRSVYIDDCGVCNLSPVSESDEITAALVERRFNGVSGRLRIGNPLRKIMRAASGHFSREALYLDRPVDFEQLEGTVLVAEHRLRHGGLFFGIGRHLKEWYSPGMAKHDRYTPPMSVAESERLLKAADDSKATWENVKFFFMMIPVWILAAVFVGGLIGAFYTVLRLLG